MITLRVRSGGREEMIDITERIQGAIAAADVDEGICLVYSPHTTCAVTVNEGWDPDVQADALRHLRTLVPRDAGFAHAEGNSDAHIKAMVVGAGAVLPVSGGRLRLGRWQAVFLCELDGPREREVWVQVR